MCTAGRYGAQGALRDLNAWRHDSERPRPFAAILGRAEGRAAEQARGLRSGDVNDALAMAVCWLDREIEGYRRDAAALRGFVRDMMTPLAGWPETPESKVAERRAEFMKVARAAGTCLSQRRRYLDACEVPRES